MSERIAAGSSNWSANSASTRRMRPASTSRPDHSSLRTSLDSASSPTCQAQRGSSILRIALTVARFALPVERRVGAVQNVERDRAERALRLDDQAPHAAEARSGGVHLDRLGIGEQQVAVAQGRLLRAEKKLGGAQLQRIVAAVQDVPQDHVRELLDEQRRHVDRALEQTHVAALERARLEQLIAEAQNDAVIVPRICVFQDIKFLFAYYPSRMLHERRVQYALFLARFLDRMDLRPQVIGAQEIVGDAQAPRDVPFQQVKAAIAPEIRQEREPTANATPSAASGTPSGRRECGGW